MKKRQLVLLLVLTLLCALLCPAAYAADAELGYVTDVTGSLSQQ